MPLSTSSAEAISHVIDVLGEPYELTAFIGQAPVRGIYVAGNEANGNELPQGFLVKQPAGAVTRAHFHEHSQFQVFVGGQGRFGNKSARPVTIQYASGHTPYGPITAGSDGIVYFTLRQRWDPGAKYMPAMRDKLIRGRQRQHLIPDIECYGRSNLARLRTPVMDELIANEDDGLYAALLRLPPEQPFRLPDAALGGGQYHVVVGGSMHWGNSTLPLHSCQFAFPHDSNVTIRADEQGLELLVLRFPR